MQRDTRAPRLPGHPGWGLAAAYVVAAALPLLAAMSSGLEAASPWSELGTGLALTATALILLQFLSSGRFERLSGRVGIDRTMGFHRVAALALLAFALAHPLAYVASTSLADPAVAWARLSGMLASPRLRSGVVALGLLAVLVVLAILRTRSFVRYEFWRASHGILAIAVAALALHHAFLVGTYSTEPPLRYLWVAFAALAAGTILTVYVVRPWRMWREDWRVEKAGRIADGIVELVLHGPEPTRLRFRGGQFIWMTLAPNRPPFHDHPFSIASSPADLPRVRLIVREAGDCTSGYAAVPPGTRVAVDGPHGSFVLPDVGLPVVMIAGGVGIAPILGILEEAASRRDPRPFRLLYAGRNPSAMAGLGRIEELQSRLDLRLACLADERAATPVFESGPICDAHIATLLAGAAPATAVAMVCGPARLMEIATDALLAAGVPASRIHYERFDFGAGRGRLDHRRRTEALAVFAGLLTAIAAFASR